MATNALLEGKGSRTALVTTMGFEDVLEIGRQSRAELYNLEQDRAPALAPWELRFGLSERVDYTGSILEDLQSDAIDALMSLIAQSDADAVAVSFLFSFLNPVHEEMVYEALRKLDPAPFISLSSRVLPEFREYERTSTVVVNAYVGQVMSRYLGELEQSLGEGPAHHAVLGREHHGAAGVGAAGADDSERPGGWSSRGIPRFGAGGTPGHHHAGYGWDIHGRFPLPWSHQGDRQLKRGRAPDQRAHESKSTQWEQAGDPLPASTPVAR